MNDLTPQTGTALALPQPADLAVMFKTERGLDPILTKLEQDALAMVKDLDPAVKKDRDLMKSAANKVSQSKAEIDRHGKALTEAQRKEVAAVNAGRKVAEEFLAALRDRVRKPADDWEAADQARKDRIRLRLDAFKPSTVPSASEGLRALIAEIEAVTVDAAWQEFEQEAAQAKATCLNRLDEHLANAVQREADAAELERLRAEAAARAEADRIRAEEEARAKAEAERIAQEAANQKDLADRLIQYFKDCIDGHIAGTPQPLAILLHDLTDRALRDMEGTGPHIDRVEAERQKAIAALKDQQQQVRERLAAGAEAERLAAVEQAKAEAAERHRKELADAEAKRLRDLEEAKAREEAAAQAERDRIAAETKAAADAKSAREADQAHRLRIRTAIADALRTMAGAATPEAIADALMAGKIPHVRIEL